MLEGVREAASFEGLIALAVFYAIISLISKAAKKGTGAAPPVPPPGTGSTSPTQEEGFSLEAVLREIERVKQQAEAGTRPPPPAEASRPRHIESSARPRHIDEAGRPRHGEEATRPRHIEDSSRPRHVEGTSRPRHIEEAARARPGGKRPRQLPNTERIGRMKAAQDERGPLGRHSRTRLPASEEFEDRTSLEEGSLEVEGRLENLDETRRREREVVDQDLGAEAVVERRIREAEARNASFSEKDHRSFHQKIARSDQVQGARGRFSSKQLRDAFVWREILGPPKSLE